MVMLCLGIQIRSTRPMHLAPSASPVVNRKQKPENRIPVSCENRTRRASGLCKILQTGWDVSVCVLPPPPQPYLAWVDLGCRQLTQLLLFSLFSFSLVLVPVRASPVRSVVLGSFVVISLWSFYHCFCFLCFRIWREGVWRVAVGAEGPVRSPERVRTAGSEV